MTRAQIADPDLGGHAARQPGRIRPCVRCNQLCNVRDNRNPIVSCIGQPSSGHEVDEPHLAGTSDHQPACARRRWRPGRARGRGPRRRARPSGDARGTVRPPGGDGEHRRRRRRARFAYGADGLVGTGGRATRGDGRARPRDRPIRSGRPRWPGDHRHRFGSRPADHGRGSGGGRLDDGRRRSCWPRKSEGSTTWSRAELWP